VATFSGTLAPPTGLALASSYTGMSGKIYVPNGDGQLIITDERDFAAMVGNQGWSVISVARG
jgi:hypothetical protein